MKNTFSGFYGIDDDASKSLWNNEKTVFIFDTNALLLLYRCEKETRDAFFSQWQKINERVWLPFHVCLEYQRNRLTAIKEHVLELENAGNHLVNRVSEALSLSLFEGKHASTIRRYDSLKGKLEELSGHFRETIDIFVKEQIDTRISEADFLKNHDTVRDRISELAASRIGSPPSQEKITNLEKIGEDRYKKKIPPGFEDEKKKKDEVFTYNEVTYKRKFGDWFIWNEILTYVEKNETSAVVYVTNDSKEDWWYEIGGRTRGPLESLKTELAAKGNGAELILYNSSSFLNAANQYLQGTPTSEEAILELERVSADALDSLNGSKNFKKSKAMNAKEYHLFMHNILNHQSINDENKPSWISQLNDYFYDEGDIRSFLSSQYENNDRDAFDSMSYEELLVRAAQVEADMEAIRIKLKNEENALFYSTYAHKMRKLDVYLKDIFLEMEKRGFKDK